MDRCQHRNSDSFVLSDMGVVFTCPNKNEAVFDTAMILLPSGNYLVSLSIKDYENDTFYVRVILSRDKGQTWQTVCKKPWIFTALFYYEDQLYMFTRPVKEKGVWVTASGDEGESWTDPVNIMPAQGKAFVGAHANFVVKNDTLYMANSDNCREMVAFACSLKKGVLNPEAWKKSNFVAMPIPEELTSGDHFTDGLGAELMKTTEGNVVDIYGRTFIIARACIDHYATQNIASIYELNGEGEDITLKFKQFYPLPGGQNRFHIVWDDVSKLFWMASTYATNSQDLIHASDQFPEYKPSPWHPIREDRRILMLSYSLDALNWFQAGCIAKAETMRQAFNSPVLVIDGEDMVALSRTAMHTDNFHDADMATFHRTEKFRQLAMDIAPKV